MYGYIFCLQPNLPNDIQQQTHRMVQCKLLERGFRITHQLHQQTVDTQHGEEGIRVIVRECIYSLESSEQLTS